MKKLMILFVVNILISSLSISQIKFEWGPKIGYNLSNLQFSHDEQSDHSLKSRIQGVQFGIFYRMGKKVYFQSETYLNSSFGKVKMINTQFSNSTLEQKFNMISVKFLFLFGYRPLFRNKISFKINIGPELSCAVAREVKPFDHIFNNNDINKFIFSLNIGGGFDIYNVIIEIHYSLGISRFMNNTAEFVSGAKNNGLVFSIGYVYDF